MAHLQQPGIPNPILHRNVGFWGTKKIHLPVGTAESTAAMSDKNTSEPEYNEINEDENDNSPDPMNTKYNGSKEYFPYSTKSRGPDREIIHQVIHNGPRN